LLERDRVLLLRRVTHVDETETEIPVPRGKAILFLVLSAPLARVIVGICGLAGMGAGAYLAWQANAATPLLVVSAVLVGLALFDWSEVTASHGESSLTLRRTKEQIEEVAERDDVPEQAREQLHQAAQAIDTVATASFATSRTLEPARTALVHWLMDRPTAKIDRDGDSLVLSFEPRTIYTMGGPVIRCVVTNPDGSTASSEERPWGTITLGYPNDFANAPSPAAGTYRAVWYQRYPWDTAISKVAEASYQFQ
jgi:hypothetical protein